eukprot:COSAG01_NODE_10655_length_2087_cov_2.554175_3_plen_39_part_01
MQMQQVSIWPCSSTLSCLSFTLITELISSFGAPACGRSS